MGTPNEKLGRFSFPSRFFPVCIVSRGGKKDNITVIGVVGRRGFRNLLGTIFPSFVSSIVIASAYLLRPPLTWALLLLKFAVDSS